MCKFFFKWYNIVSGISIKLLFFGIFFKVNKCIFHHHMCFYYFDEFRSFLCGSSNTPLEVSSSMFSRNLVGTQKYYVTEMSLILVLTPRKVAHLCSLMSSNFSLLAGQRHDFGV